MKKHFAYNSSHQIWRILISESDKLILETRDMDSKEVYFHCFDLSSGEQIFKNYQFEEKSWIGIEAVHKDIIYFHKYVKPDMPGHKEVIAFDINSQRILWTNEDLVFYFPYEDKVFCFKQGFEERFFYCLNYQTGEITEDLGSNYTLVNSLKGKSEAAKDWSVYIYPQNINTVDGNILKLINNQTSSSDIAGNIEFITYNDLLLFNYHNVVNEKKYNNNFTAVNIDSGEIVLKELLNAGAASLYTDSFFIYKNFLFLLKEKNEVIIFKLG